MQTVNNGKDKLKNYCKTRKRVHKLNDPSWADENNNKNKIVTTTTTTTTTQLWKKVFVLRMQ